MAKLEFWADVELNDQIEEWLLLQGAKVTRSFAMPVLKGQQWVDAPPIVMFGGRQIHYYGTGKLVRIFFNERNESSRTLMLLKFPDAIKDHNFKDMNFND